MDQMSLIKGLKFALEPNEWLGQKIDTGSRIGISVGTDKPWRFYAAENDHVSRR